MLKLVRENLEVAANLAREVANAPRHQVEDEWDESDGEDLEDA